MWTPNEKDLVFQVLKNFEGEMVELQKSLISIPALGPENNGEGEKEKADFLKSELKKWGLSFCEIDAPDERVKSRLRPNLVVRYKGRREERTVWVITHLDVVPAGPEELWNSPPYKALVKDGKIFGRGAEDNHQEMVASIFALLAIKEAKLVPNYDVGLLFMADEETGSNYGAKFILENYNLFQPDDIIIVPDAGHERGDVIEVAEKGILWLKFRVLGKQCHASTPEKGINAFRASAWLITELDCAIKKNFQEKDLLFEPPTTTFEPTKHEANIPNINTIPGEEIFYVDCRYLPSRKIENIISVVKEVAKKAEEKFNTEIEVLPVHTEIPGPKTDPNSWVVKFLSKGIREVYQINSKPVGIGGGTVAAFFRKKGFPAAVWGKVVGTAHQANEYCLIENMVGDALVYAYIFGLDTNDFKE